MKFLSLFSLCLTTSLLADNSNGLAPEVTDLNAKDVSYTLEAKIQYLDQAFIDTSPENKNDGIPVGELGVDGGNKEKVLEFIQEIADNKHGNTDSFLIYHKGKLLLESYFKRGRANYPHYQMSITKSYTAFALGRAMQLGHISMNDLDKPVISFLNEIDRTNLAQGTADITLHEAMHMMSGIRIDKAVSKKLMKNPAQLKGQGQIQAYMDNTNPITPKTKVFKYQGADPSMTMQVLEAIVPGSAKDFIKNELLKPLGILNYGWQADISGLPKSAAGSSIRSRDMLKFGMLILNKGKWQNETIIPEEFVEKATGPIDVNPHRTYGYFWWGHNVELGGKTYLCKSGRGAGGQFILMFPEIDLILISTAHNKGMGKMLKQAPARLIPAFLEN